MQSLGKASFVSAPVAGLRENSVTDPAVDAAKALRPSGLAATSQAVPRPVWLTVPQPLTSEVMQSLGGSS